MVLPILKKVNPGVQPKSGLIEKAKSCKCSDPELRVRKVFNTQKDWLEDHADPETSDFLELKLELEMELDSVYFSFPNYTGVQVLRAWTTTPVAPPPGQSQFWIWRNQMEKISLLFFNSLYFVRSVSEEIFYSIRDQIMI